MARMTALACAALALAGMAAPSALAETKTFSVTVSYADLNLASPAGAQTMLDRLQKATRKVCRPAPLRNPEEMEWARACMTEAMSSAVHRLNAPVVTAMFLDTDRFNVAAR